MADTKNDPIKPVEDAVKAADEKGFIGRDTDPTPNANYTLKGVTSGAPTPETDDKQAEKVRTANNV